MLGKIKRITVFTVFMIICIIFLSIFTIPVEITTNYDDLPFLNTKPSSASVHAPIIINDNADLENQFGGAGIDGLSWETAYIIEDYEIDAGGTGSGIKIGNINRYIIIRNCTITGAGSDTYSNYNHDSGILLFNCIYIKIMECNLSYNELNGLTLNNCNYINISNNFIFNNTIISELWSINDYGVYLVDSSNNIISENTVLNNKDGIRLERSNYNTLSDNNISNNIRYGISITDSDHNTLSENAISISYYGIYLYTADFSTFSGNFVFHNDVGLMFYNSHDNSIFDNKLVNNTSGIYLTTSNNNEITQNEFCDNFGTAIFSMFGINYIHNNNIQHGGGEIFSIIQYNLIFFGIAVTIILIAGMRKKMVEVNTKGKPKKKMNLIEVFKGFFILFLIIVLIIISILIIGGVISQWCVHNNIQYRYWMFINLFLIVFTIWEGIIIKIIKTRLIKIEKIKKKGDEQLKLISKRKMEIVELFKKSKNIRLNIISEKFLMTEAEFVSFLIENPKELSDIIIDGNNLIIPEDQDVGEFISILDKQFESWQLREKYGDGKKI